MTEKRETKQTKQQTIDEFYDLLQKIYHEKHCEAHQIYAGDEVGIDGDELIPKKWYEKVR